MDSIRPIEGGGPPRRAQTHRKGKTLLTAGRLTALAGDGGRREVESLTVFLAFLACETVDDDPHRTHPQGRALLILVYGTYRRPLNPESRCDVHDGAHDSYGFENDDVSWR
jgi:hypothetical protein